MPPRIHPPEEAFLYSNCGYALAALIVEEVSGTPFDQYVQHGIFHRWRLEDYRTGGYTSLMAVGTFRRLRRHSSSMPSCWTSLPIEGLRRLSTRCTPGHLRRTACAVRTPGHLPTCAPLHQP
jgi:CubicO group peptidase (beta-lactamase class C family)